MTLTPLDNEYNFEIKPSKDIRDKSHVEEFLIIYTLIRIDNTASL